MFLTCIHITTPLDFWQRNTRMVFSDPKATVESTGTVPDTHVQRVWAYLTVKQLLEKQWVGALMCIWSLIEDMRLKKAYWISDNMSIYLFSLPKLATVTDFSQEPSCNLNKYILILSIRKQTSHHKLTTAFCVCVCLLSNASIDIHNKLHVNDYVNIWKLFVIGSSFLDLRRRMWRKRPWDCRWSTVLWPHSLPWWSPSHWERTQMCFINQKKANHHRGLVYLSINIC